MLQRFLGIFRSPRFADRERTRIAAVLSPCVWTTVAATVSFMLLVWPVSPTPRADGIILGSSLIMCLAVLRLMHAGRVAGASVIFVATLCVVISGSGVLLRHLDHSAEYMIVIMIAGALLGGLGAGAVALVFLITHSVAVWIVEPSVDLGTTVLLGIEFLATTAFMSIAHRSVRDALAEADGYAEALVKARDQALQASEFKSRFLSSMSHEIRTPMTAISGMTDLLGNNHLDPQSAEYVQTIRTSVDSLMVIINDILDMSRIESGRMALESRPLDLRACVAGAVRLIAAQAETAGLDLVVHVHPEVPAAILGDATRVQQILLNLSSNAVKFTREGRVELRVSATPIARDPAPVDENRPAPADATHRLYIQVEDTGIGIPDEFRGRLFEPFSQADASTTREYGGSGLGLAITAQLVHLMGGEIRVDSELGRGSTFTVELPVVETQRSDACALSRSSDERTLDATLARSMPLDILVVDDNPLNRKLALHLLTRMGYSPRALDNGRQAAESWREPCCQVIFMDVQMPEMDGLEATRQIRAAAGGERPYIVGLTANALPEDRQRCYAAGMDEHLAKPFTPAQLKAALERASHAIARR